MSELISAEGTELSLGPETRGAGTWPGEPCPGPLVGRDVELSLLRGLVDPAPVASSVLFVVGDPGIGKTVLLADMAQRARSAGARVLAITGRESEANVAFAALHQLLRPVVDSAVALPERQRMALRGALGLAQVPVAPNQLMTGIAALTLLSALAEPSPLLVIVDDAHLLDRSSSWAGGGQHPWPPRLRASRSCALIRCWPPTPEGYWTGSRIRRADVLAGRCSPRRQATRWR